MISVSKLPNPLPIGKSLADIPCCESLAFYIRFCSVLYQSLLKGGGIYYLRGSLFPYIPPGVFADLQSSRRMGLRHFTHTSGSAAYREKN